ncbi:hypothetical protein ACWGJZ_07600, partial [Streptomyces rimosus]
MKQLHIKVLVGLFLAAGVLAWAGARLWDALGTLRLVSQSEAGVVGGVVALGGGRGMTMRSRLEAGGGGGAGG